MAKDVNEAPDPDSPEFQRDQNMVERVSPDTTADAAAIDTDAISTDPGRSKDGD